MTTIFIIVLVALAFSILMIIALFKGLNTLKKNRDDLMMQVLKLNGEIEYLKTLGDLKDEIYQKSNEKKSALDSGNSRNRFNSANNILHNNES